MPEFLLDAVTAGVGEGSCSTKNAPGANVVTFLKSRK